MTVSTDSILPAALRARRRELGRLSVSEAARQAGVSRLTWRAWEVDGRRPLDDKWTDIERVLRWTHGSVEAALTGGEPTPIPEPEPVPVDPDLERAKEAYKVWINKYPPDEADAKLDEYIRLLLAERKRAKSRSSDRRDIDQQTTNTFG